MSTDEANSQSIISVQQAADSLHVTPRQVINLIVAGTLPAQRIGPATRGGQWVLNPTDVERLRLARLTDPPKAGWVRGRKRKSDE